METFYEKILKIRDCILEEQALFHRISESKNEGEFKEHGFNLLDNVLTNILALFDSSMVRWIYGTLYSYKYKKHLGFTIVPQNAFSSEWHRAISHYPQSRERAKIFDLVNAYSVRKRPLVFVMGTRGDIRKSHSDDMSVILPQDLLIGDFFQKHFTEREQISHLGDLEAWAAQLSNTPQGKDFIDYLHLRFDRILGSDLRRYESISLILLCQRLLLRRVNYYYCIPAALSQDKVMNSLELALIDQELGDNEVRGLSIVTDLLYGKLLASEVL